MLSDLQALYGVQAVRARWRNCVKYAVTYFGMAVSRLFVEQHFTKEMRSNVSVKFGYHGYRKIALRIAIR